MYNIILCMGTWCEVRNFAWHRAGLVKANLHWGRARSSRAWFFVCFIAPRSCRAEPCTSAESPDATKHTKDYAWQLLARPQCRLTFTLDRSVSKTSKASRQATPFLENLHARFVFVRILAMALSSNIRGNSKLWDPESIHINFKEFCRFFVDK